MRESGGYWGRETSYGSSSQVGLRSRYSDDHSNYRSDSRSFPPSSQSQDSYGRSHHDHNRERDRYASPPRLRPSQYDSMGPPERQSQLRLEDAPSRPYGKAVRSMESTSSGRYGGPGYSERTIMGDPGYHGSSAMPMNSPGNTGPGGPGMPMGGPGGQGMPMAGPGGQGMPMAGPGGPGMSMAGPGGPGMHMAGPGGPGMHMAGPGGPANTGMGGFENQQAGENLASSINALSQMNAQQSDIASKIISAVLSTNLIGNLASQQGSSNNPGQMGNQQGPGQEDMMGQQQRIDMPRPHPSPRRGKMGGFNDRKPFRGSSSPPMRGSSRRFGPSAGRGSFDRFSSERRGVSPRTRRGFRSRFEGRGRALELKDRLRVPQKSWADSSSNHDSSNFKRRRSSSDDRADKKTRGDSEDGGKGRNTLSYVKSDGDATNRKVQDKLDESPGDALQCHMCKMEKFTSEETYLFHLEGVRHKKTSAAFHAKNEATLEFLRKNAQLAGIRYGGMDKSVAPSQCTVCTAYVKEGFYKHKTLLEHKIVRKFIKPFCCGRQFRSRFEFEEHKLSLPHLMKSYEVTKKKVVVTEEYAKGDGGKWTYDDALRYLKKKVQNEDSELTFENILPYDGNSIVGVEFLEQKESILCTPCQVLLPIGVKSLENHMVSFDHYNTLIDFLHKQKLPNKQLGSEDSSFTNKMTEKQKREHQESDDDDDELVVLIRSDDEESQPGDNGSHAQSDDNGHHDDNKSIDYFDEDDHIVVEEIGGEDAAMEDEEN